jgi:hypothetical protein
MLLTVQRATHVLLKVHPKPLLQLAEKVLKKSLIIGQHIVMKTQAAVLMGICGTVRTVSPRNRNVAMEAVVGILSVTMHVQLEVQQFTTPATVQHVRTILQHLQCIPEERCHLLMRALAHTVQK